MKLTPEENSPPEFAVECAAYSLGAKLVSFILVLYCWGMGLSIIIGGAPRFAGPSYEIALKVPGAPAIWGIVMILAGSLAILGLLRKKPGLTTIGMIVAGIWSMFFASAFATAAYKYPDANLTAMWVYGKDALVFLAFGVVFHSSYYPRRGRGEIQKHSE